MIDAVGVVGAGVMGVSLAQAITARGIEAVVYDSNATALDLVDQRIAEAGRLARFGARRSETRPPGQLITTDRLADLARCPVVVENVVEDVAVKARIHQALDRILPAEAVVAVNTSAIPISEVASSTERPERVVGAHFMNPVSASAMVEVIRTPYVASWAVARVEELAAALGRSRW